MNFKNTKITLNAYGKINLGLDVTGVRSDGYHLVKMVMQTVGIYDRITLEREAAKAPQIDLTCDRADVPAGRSNIAWRAAEALIGRCGINDGVRIHIEKNIPMAAGMAGGSTDAAAVLLGMNEIFGLGMTQGELDDEALRLGADVPFCLRRGTYLSEGIGEILTKLPDAPDAYVLIVNPPFEVSTAQVYKALDGIREPIHPDIDSLCLALEGKGLGAVALATGNILAQVTEPEHPLITEIRCKMTELGALAGMMTGSGPTVFGLFDDEEKAREAFAWFRAHAGMGDSFLTGFIK